MNEAKSSKGPSSGNKSTILLLVAGIVIMAIAAVVYIVRKPPKPTPRAEHKKVEAPAIAPAPLVISQKAKPIGLQSPDEGSSVLTAEEVPEKDHKKKKKSGDGHPEKMGVIDTAAVNKIMNSKFGQVRVCYERRLKKNPMLEGNIDLNITIATSGKVKGIRVNKDTVRDGEMLSCVKRVIKGWSFPKPVGGKVVVGKSFKFKKKI